MSGMLGCEESEFSILWCPLQAIQSERTLEFVLFLLLVRFLTSGEGVARGSEIFKVLSVWGEGAVNACATRLDSCGTKVDSCANRFLCHKNRIDSCDTRIDSCATRIDSRATRMDSCSHKSRFL